MMSGRVLLVIRRRWREQPAERKKRTKRSGEVRRDLENSPRTTILRVAVDREDSSGCRPRRSASSAEGSL